MDQLTLINQCFEKKILLNKELLSSSQPEIFLTQLQNIPSPQKLLILNQDNSSFIEKEIDWLEFDKHRVNLEKKQLQEPYSIFINGLEDPTTNIPSTQPLKHPPFNIITNHQIPPQKYQVRDFTRLFISRYKFMENLLRTRPELSNILSINKILNKKEKDTVSLIAIISEINQTKANNFILTVEDLTGKIKIIINQNKKDLYQQAKDLVPDEVVGITGTNGTNQQNIVFAENIIHPDIPLNKEFKKHPQDIHVAFLSDFHVGSTEFLEEEFDKFLDWINQKTGNKAQKELAQKIKYLIITGDLVEGVGIYPNQDKELLIKDIHQQYQVVATLLKKIPSHIQIIACTGNHEPLHLAEPQPPYNPKYIQPLLEIPNLALVSNPAIVNIASTPQFSGFDVLLYHGYSFDYYVANVDSIRSQGGYHRADLIMKFLLQRRHLAPSFGSTPYLPTHEDHLLIKKIPDFFITGHIHYSIAANYRNITMICGSCWQSKNSFQEKLGHEPEPARVPIVNLQTRDIKILKFI